MNWIFTFPIGCEKSFSFALVNDSDGMPMKLAPQFHLRTVFLIFFCAAVGLTCATAPRTEDPLLSSLGYHVPQLNIHYGLLSTAATAMVIGLARQAWMLARWKPPVSANGGNFSFAKSFAIGWRLSLAILITICIVARVLISRQFLNLSEHPDFYPDEVLPEAVLLICIIVVLSVSVNRWIGKMNKPAKVPPWRFVVASIISLALVLIILPDRGLIVYLVHIATEGIELVQKFHRVGTFPNQQLQGYRLFWLSFGATIAVVLAAVGLAMTRATVLTTKTFIAVIAGCFALLTGAAVFCTWYYRTEYPLLSPDFASVGLASNWLDWAGGGIVAALVTSATAYKWASRTGTQKIRLPVDRGTAGKFFPYESSLCLLLLIGAAAAQTIERLRAYSPRGFPSIIDIMSVLVAGSTSYLMLAMLILCIQLGWIRWRRGKQDFNWELSELDRGRFIWNWAAIAVVTVVAIPTFSIYSFAFWLGPWYLYGS